MVSSPFVWGQGGRRMTPEEIARQRAIAEQQRMAGADFSPVGSIWEGLGRVGQGVMSGISQRDARRADDANRAESQALVEALLSGGQDSGPNDVLAALANPYIGDEARQIAMMQYQRMNPEPPKPTEFARLLQERGIVPGSDEYNRLYDQYIASKGDRDIVANLPGGQFFAGPTSQLKELLGGGQAQPPSAPVGELTPLDESEVSIYNTPPPQLGSDGFPINNYMTRDQYNAVVNALGAEKTAEWAARNNMRIGN